LFEPTKKLRKSCMRIVTGSEALDDAIEAEGSIVYDLYALVAPERTDELKQKLLEPGFGWGHAKQALFEEVEAMIAPIRARFEELRADEAALDRILEEGAERAEPIARATLDRVRHAVGIRRGS
jgi:tryptophanyl-tRNA synthetase